MVTNGSSAVDGAPKHLRFVDGLRGFAVLVVLAYHVGERSAGIRAASYSYFVGFGSRGVELFFVLSGLCLSYPLLRRALIDGATARIDLRAYATARLLRILPPYYATLCLFIAIASTPAWTRIASFAPHCVRLHITPLETFQEFVFWDANLPIHNLSFWTLDIEFHWYFMFPLALWLFVRFRALFYAVVAYLVANDIWHFAMYGDLVLLPALLSGIVAADLILRPPWWLRYTPVLCVVCFALAAFRGVRPGDHLSVEWQATCFFFVLAASRPTAWRRLLESRPFVMIGIASYSIYLVHEPLLTYFEQVDGLSIVASFLATLGVGIAAWLAFEYPVTHRTRVRHAFLAVFSKLTGILDGVHLGLGPIVRYRYVEVAPASKSLP